MSVEADVEFKLAVSRARCKTRLFWEPQLKVLLDPSPTQLYMGARPGRLALRAAQAFTTAKVVCRR